MDSISWTEPPPDRDPGVYGEGMRYLVGGRVLEWSGPSFDVFSPVHLRRGKSLEARKLGTCALLDAAVAREALAAAVSAYDHGRGAWPTAPVAERIRAMGRFLDLMAERRLEVARLLCWEVGKPWADALVEFDRTVEYGRETLKALKTLDRTASGFALDGGFLAQIRRAPYGVALCMGPYNYPLNETFATLLPALVMGNTAVVKLPRLGMLCNLPLLEPFAEAFPPGVVNMITGEGGVVVPPIVETGEVDLLAFIGSAKVANSIAQRHPRPNRLRSVLGLGAKNPGVVLADADVGPAVKECVQGALTFNGQRCTALKILFVQRKLAEEFVARVCEAVNALPKGMPYVDGAFLTPLPEPGAVAKMTRLVEDAVARGAKVMNRGGASVDRTFFQPAVVYPVARGMRLWDEEQFGPIVAIAPFDDPREVLDYMAASPYGQQASLFTRDPAAAGPLVDAMVNQVCRVNLNTQCRRGPDTFPFAGRKDSAEGTLSVTDALRAFSIRSLVSAKDAPESVELVQGIVRGRHSRFLTTDYLF